MVTTPRVPPETSSFIGRGEELAMIRAALGPNRLVTLVGPGGCGKTRLALRAAHEASARWMGGAIWVGLEQLTDPADVAGALGDALGVLTPPGGDPAAGLVRELRDLEILVALDNCEHVLDGVAGLVSALLPACPQVGVIATSRSPIMVAGERVVRLAALSLPDALDLFLDRAGLDPGDGVSASTRAGARRVCDRLDRLPLALELAAGWVGTLTPDQIADALRDPYPLLEGGARSAPFRQRTLEASMRWSHDLLDPDEQLLFRRLAVFEPGFDASAVLALARTSEDDDDGRYLRALRGLVDTSMVVADTSGPVARYRMLATVRAYAHTKLAAAGESDEVHRQHLDVQLARVTEMAGLLETDKDAWRATVGPDYPNIRRAIEWGLESADPTPARRLATSMTWLWHLEGHGAEGLRLLGRAVEIGRGESTALQAECLVALALVADTSAPGGHGYQLAVDARALAEQTGADAAARLARSLTGVALLGGDLDAAVAEAEQARVDAAAAGDRFVADASTALIGLVHLIRDQHRAAIEVLAPAAEGLIGRGDRGVGSSALAWLALATARSGDVRAAEPIARRAVEVAAALRDVHRVGLARSTLVEIALLAGEVESARSAWAPIEAVLAAAAEDVFVPGRQRAQALLELAGEPDSALRRPQRPADVSFIGPSEQLLRAVALRRSGDTAGASAIVTGLTSGPAGGYPPAVTAAVVEQRALLLADTDPDGALDLHHEALRIRADHDLVLGCIDSLELVAELLQQRGADELGGILAGAAAQARDETGYLGGTTTTDHRPTDPEFEPAAVELGRRLTLREAVAQAQRARGPRRRPASGWASLTPTERSVVELTAQGLSNPEIAARLFVSRATVKTHLAHVYTKLGVANRTELTRLAVSSVPPALASSPGDGAGRTSRREEADHGGS